MVGLGVAKAIAESGVTTEPWANTRIEKNGTQVSIYGRNLNTASWRRPVDTINRMVAPIHPEKTQYDFTNLRRLFTKYLPKWESYARDLTLFDSYGDKPMGKDVFEVLGHAYKLWENDAFDLVLIKKEPHVKGFHFVVSPKKGYARQWQTVVRGSEQPYIHQSAEGVAIALGVQTLMGGTGEIHNSGNWAANLKLREDDAEKGRISSRGFVENRKVEKRLHRPDIARDDEKIETYSYFHVYIPDTGPVTLPTMKLEEARHILEHWSGGPDLRMVAEKAIADWDGITPPTQDDLERAQAKMGNGILSRYLQKNFAPARATI
ncbi:MAG: hypothetical protein Q8L37_05060 [Candidatus Gottesmanbacteria bacterium]|nr:hypothetical protein [Candidatus Gottesmanbacteria bacterium]